MDFSTNNIDESCEIPSFYDPILFASDNDVLNESFLDQAWPETLRYSQESETKSVNEGFVSHSFEPASLQASPFSSDATPFSSTYSESSASFDVQTSDLAMNFPPLSPCKLEQPYLLSSPTSPSTRLPSSQHTSWSPTGSSLHHRSPTTLPYSVTATSPNPKVLIQRYQPETSSTNMRLSSHLSATSPTSSAISKATSRRHKCSRPRCTSTFSRLSDLARHTRDVHKGGNVWKCDHPGCSHFSRRSDKVKEHCQKVHHHAKGHERLHEVIA